MESRRRDDRGVMKRRYMKAISKYEILRLWRNDELKAVTNELKLAEGLLKAAKYDARAKCNSPNAQRYEVFTTEFLKSDILILHRGKSPNIIEVVSAEDSFDLFYDIHQVTGHGGKEKMLQYLRQRYHISIVCLNIFLSLCNMCPAYKNIKTIENNFSYAAMVTLFDFTNDRDGDFGYVLVYKLKWSGFTIIRPITITDYEKDVAVELLNIFLDFGPPFKILVNCTDIDIYQSILTTIMSVTCDFNIVIERQSKFMLMWVLKYIRDWMANSGCKNWSLACHLIQWHINNSEPIDLDTKINAECPYKAHFKPLTRGVAKSSDKTDNDAEREVLTSTKLSEEDSQNSDSSDAVLEEESLVETHEISD